MGFASIWNRTYASVRGALGAGVDAMQATIGLASLDEEATEQAIAAYREGGIWGSIKASPNVLAGQVNRGFQSAGGNLFAPDTGVGAAIGGLPEAVRAPSRTVLEKSMPVLVGVQRAANTVGNVPGVATQRATRDDATYLSQITSDSVLNPQVWRQAWNNSDKVSLGQAVVLGVRGLDPLDPAASQRANDSALWTMFSGGIDAISQWYIPGPEEVVALGARSARAAHVARQSPTISGPKAVDHFFKQDRSWVAQGAGKVIGRLGGNGQVAAQVRDRLMEGGFHRWEQYIGENTAKITAEVDEAFGEQFGKLGTDQQTFAQELNDLTVARDKINGELEGLDAPDTAHLGGALATDYENQIALKAQKLEEIDLRQQTLLTERDRVVRHRVAGQIHQQLGGGNVAHAPLASALAHASDAAERELIWRVFSGDQSAIDTLRTTNQLIASELDDLQVRIIAGANIHSLDVDTAAAQLHNADGVLGGYAKLRDELLAEQRRLDRIDAIRGAADRLQAPGVGQVLGDAAYDRIIGTSPVTGKPVRLWQKMPDHVWDLNTSQSYIDGTKAWLTEAGFDAGEIAERVGRLVDSESAAHRFIALSTLEEEIFRRLANKHGVDRPLVDQVLAMAKEARVSQRDILRNGGNKYGVVNLPDEHLFFDEPLTKGQLADTFVPLDVAKADEVLGRYAKWAQEHPDAAGAWSQRVSGHLEADTLRGSRTDRAAAVAASAWGEVTALWKIGRVARPAFTTRALMLDELFRMASKVGELSAALAVTKGLPRVAGHFFQTHGAKGGAVVGGMVGFTFGGGPMGAALGAAVGSGVGAAMPKSWVSWLAKYGDDIDAFGDTADAAAAMRSKVAEAPSWRAMTADGSKIATEALDDTTRRTGRFEVISRASEGYAKAWARVVNRQLREDTLFRQALEGRSREAMVGWMNSKAGLEHRRLFDPRLDRDPREWVDNIIALRNQVFNNDTELMKVALERKVNPADVDRIPLTARSDIHAEVIKEAVGDGGTIRNGMKIATRALVDAFASLPEAELLRIPYYRMRYDEVLKKRLDLLQGDVLTGRDIARFKQQAREQALKDTKDLFYSYADRSRFADIVKHVAPFFSPFENAVRKWAGLTLENPVFTARMVDGYQRLIENLTDEITDENGDTLKVVVMPDGVVDRLRIFPWFKALPEGVAFEIDPRSINVMLNSPGAGPWAVALKPVARKYPRLQDGLKLVMPFGPGPEQSLTRDFLDEFTPTLVSRIQRQYEDEDTYQKMVVRYSLLHLSRMEQGLEPMITRGDPGWEDFQEQVKREVDAVMALQAMASLWSPARTRMTTWAEPYIRAMRAEQNKGDTVEIVDGKKVAVTPMDRFIRRFGDELVPVVQSMYKNNLSLPTTVEGWEALNDEDGIGPYITRAAKEDPALARLIVGSVGSGSQAEHSYWVWQQYRQTETYAGSGENIVEAKTVVEAFEAPDIQRGWQEYTAMMDQIVAKAEEHGVSINSDVVKSLRSKARDMVAEAHPAWWREYNKPPDREAFNRRISLLTDIANDPQFEGRLFIPGLRDYLGARQMVAERLASGEFKTLGAQGNTALREVWNRYVTDLVADEPAFSDLYFYLLESDPYNETLTVEASDGAN